MNTGVYESAVLINAALDDEQIENVISRIKETITNNGGEIRHIDKWGRKRLAYMVEKSKIGYYAIFRFDAPAALISKLERSYSLDDHVLRFLTLKLDEDALEFLEKNSTSSETEGETAKVEEPTATVNASNEENEGGK